jgi:hypothetical protein
VNAKKKNKNSGITPKSPVLPNIKDKVALEENNTESANHNSKFQMRQQH